MDSPKSKLSEESGKFRELQRSRRWMLGLLLGFAPMATFFFFLTRSDEATFWFALAYGFAVLFAAGLHGISRYAYMKENRKKEPRT